MLDAFKYQNSGSIFLPILFSKLSLGPTYYAQFLPIMLLSIAHALCSKLYVYVHASSSMPINLSVFNV